MERVGVGGKGDTMAWIQCWTPEAKIITWCLEGSPCVEGLSCLSELGACPALPLPHRVGTENHAQLSRVAIQPRLLDPQRRVKEPDHRPEGSEDVGRVCVMNASQTLTPRGRAPLPATTQVFACALSYTSLPSFIVYASLERCHTPTWAGNKSGMRMSRPK